MFNIIRKPNIFQVKMTKTTDIFEYTIDKKRLMERLQSQLQFLSPSPEDDSNEPFETILDLNKKDAILQELWKRATERVQSHLSAWPEVPERVIPLALCLLDALMVTELAPELPASILRCYDPQTALDDLRASLFRQEWQPS